MLVILIKDMETNKTIEHALGYKHILIEPVNDGLLVGVEIYDNAVSITGATDKQFEYFKYLCVKRNEEYNNTTLDVRFNMGLIGFGKQSMRELIDFLKNTDSAIPLEIRPVDMVIWYRESSDTTTTEYKIVNKLIMDKLADTMRKLTGND